MNQDPVIEPTNKHAADLGLPETSDDMNAARFAHMFRGRLLWVDEEKKWRWWDGTRWNDDRGGLVAMSAAKQVSLAIVEHELRVRPSARIHSAAGLKAMVELARSERGMNTSIEHLNRDADYLINCANGTFDLRTRELRPADPKDLLTQSTGLAYDPDAECPKFEAHVAWTMQDDSEMVEFLRRAIGYSATGNMSERVMFTAYGEGANGKGVLFEVVKDALGDYSQTATPGLFERKRNRGSTNDLARTKDARFLLANEAEDGAAFSAEVVKNMAGGGDTVTARFLYQENFEFRPIAKAWVVTNHLLRVDADDQAMWDRIRVVPFENRVERADRDPRLPDKLREELPGILRWIIDGASEWLHEGGLPTPERVVVASQDYRDAMDVFDDFLDDRCILQDDLRVTPAVLLAEFDDWARHQKDVEKLNSASLKETMKRKGFEYTRPGGQRTYKGLAIKPPEFERRVAAESERRINWQRLLEEAIKPPEDDDDVALEEHVAPSREAVSPNGDTTTTNT